MKWFTNVITLLHTEACSLCGITMIPDPSRPGLCERCVHEILDIPGPFVPDTLPQVTAARKYGGAITRALEVIKIGGNRRLAVTMARLLLEPIYQEINLPLVPVPAAPSERRRRGFDQSIVMAHSFGGSVLSVIGRRSGTPQKHLDREHRHENALRQFFIISPLVVLPEEILLLDDVVTTGATLNRCGELLQAHGVQRWRALTVTVRV